MSYSQEIPPESKSELIDVSDETIVPATASSLEPDSVETADHAHDTVPKEIYGPDALAEVSEEMQTHSVGSLESSTPFHSSPKEELQKCGYCFDTIVESADRNLGNGRPPSLRTLCERYAPRAPLFTQNCGAALPRTVNSSSAPHAALSAAPPITDNHAPRSMTPPTRINEDQRAPRPKILNVQQWPDEVDYEPLTAEQVAQIDPNMLILNSRQPLTCTTERILRLCPPDALSLYFTNIRELVKNLPKTLPPPDSMAVPPLAQAPSSSAQPQLGRIQLQNAQEPQQNVYDPNAPQSQIDLPKSARSEFNPPPQI
jgi:hypothetical protein